MRTLFFTTPPLTPAYTVTGSGSTYPLENDNFTKRTQNGVPCAFLVFILMMALLFPGKLKSQIFVNGDFEVSSTCNVNDCEDTDIDCVDGWGNHESPSLFDDVAWIYYDDYFQCTTQDISLEACGDDRGIRLYRSTGTSYFLYPVTSNPFKGLSANSVYEISLDFLIIDKTLGGAILEVWVDNSNTDQSPSTAIQVGEVGGFTDENVCYDAKVVIANPSLVEELVTHDYLIFRVSGENPPSPPESEAEVVDAVMDNIAGCSILDIAISTQTCDHLCLEITSPCVPFCDTDRDDIPELNDCYMGVTWEYWNGTSWEEVDFCEYMYIGEEICCIEPEEYGEYRVFVDYIVTVNGEVFADYFEIAVNFEPCSTVVISTNTTWDATDIDAFTRFDVLTVQSGATLTIEDDLTLRFCEDGKMVINPGGKVIHHGILTSDCAAGWQGVEVQGNGATNQYPVSSLYQQGQLYCNEGSEIHHAQTAVKLYGPDAEDAGGMIFADGAFFINNRRGLDFAPFSNYFPTYGKQQFYYSSIRNCEFNITDEYPLALPFKEHVRLEGIFGLGMYGTYFLNDQILEDAEDPRQYGVGITSVNSGFTVGATAIDIEDEPCFPGDCDMKRESRFVGLGIGIDASQYLRNKPFHVYSSEFDRCFFGISNEGISGVRILHNDFLMGEIKELKQDENQVGISLSGYQQIGAVQQNQFLHTAGNADFTLGIIAHNIGEMTNVINDNLFSGLDIGNEAVGINGTGNGEDLRGLYYVCNENEDVIDKDFYVRDRTGFEDYINFWQAQYGQTYFRSAGNTFSVSGDPDDGHFANYGDLEITYYYNQLQPLQIPDEDRVINVFTLPANPATCIFEPCLHPCPDDIDIGDFSDEFYFAYSSYANEIEIEEFENAALIRVRIDSILNGLLRWFEWDTTDFNVDTLRAWYSRVDAIAGQIHLSKDFIQSGHYSLAAEVIDSIKTQFPLQLEQQLDMDRVLAIIDILSNRSTDSLSTDDIDSLMLYAQGIGVSYTMARSILTSVDSIFTPRYYIPGEVNPRSGQFASEPLPLSQALSVYPTPSSQEVTIQVPEEFIGELHYVLWDLSGRNLIKGTYQGTGKASALKLNLADLNDGLYWVSLTSSDLRVRYGKVLIIN